MNYYSFARNTAKVSGVVLAVCVPLLIANYSSQSPPTPPYMVPAGQETDVSLSCVSGALASLERTAFINSKLVLAVNSGGVEGVMVLLPGSGIPDPGTVPRGGNVKIESLLNLFKPGTA